MVQYLNNWNQWRKSNTNGIFHHILVLFGLIRSPTFDFIYEKDGENCLSKKTGKMLDASEFRTFDEFVRGGEHIADIYEERS